MVNTAIKRGEYLLIAVDGTEKLVSEKPRMAKLCKEIGCDYIDTVILKRHKGQPSVIICWWMIPE